jgi:hypothetical protein
MIVRTLPDSIQLITQPDHAHLAGCVIGHTPALATHPRRDSILRAAIGHDNGWIEPDAAPSVLPGTGRIADFINAPAEVRQGVWPRGVATLSDDPWAAALVAQHAIAVYDRFQSDPVWMPFFERMAGIRNGFIEQAARSLEDLRKDYWFVRLADLMSLSFCTGSTDRFPHGDSSVQFTGTRVVVTPDVFGGITVPIAIEAVVLPNRMFESDADLRAAIAAGGRTTIHGEAGAP